MTKATENTEETKIIAIKGFGPDWKCRDFQYAIGKTYTHDGELKICASGFHAVEYPLDVFAYYRPVDSKFALVEMVGPVVRHNDDSKVASASITISAELKIPEIVSRAFDWIMARVTPADTNHATGNCSASSATGDCSASSATGYRSASSATGYRSASSATGYRSASSATGNSSASSATGDCSASSATGNSSASSATGDCSASSATGNRSASSATGNSSASSATGNCSASSATGDCSASSATGYRSASSATGYRSASSATGDCSASSATGDCSASLATGNYSTAEVIKPDSGSVAIATGYGAKAKGAVGCAIVLCNRDDEGNLRHIRASKVGENGIKPDVFYTLDDDGNFQEESNA